MTDEDLISVLQDWPYMGETYAKNAADRIEQLAATCEELVKERDRWKDACRSASKDLNIIVPDNDRLKSERDAAEAKLAKTVEMLNSAVKWADRYRWAAPWVDDAHTVLAELEKTE